MLENLIVRNGEVMKKPLSETLTVFNSLKLN